MENSENTTEQQPPPGVTPGGTGATVVIEDQPVAQNKKEQIGKIARTDAAPSGREPQIMSRTYEDKTTIEIKPPQVEMIKENPDFGKIASTVVGFKTDKKSYAAELLPHPQNVSPFKELDVSQAEESVLIGTANAMRKENCVISYFALPRGFDSSTNFDPESPQGIMTHASLPMVTMLCENEHGFMLNDVTYPIIASPHPAATASYVHNVQMRRSGEGIDMRYIMTASDNNKLVEHYTLGRVWVPLNACYITFNLSGDNYDAAEPSLEAAFDVLKNPRLMHPKDISAFTTSLRFVDTMDVRTMHIVYGALRQLSHNKLSLSRLYWRMWSLLYEAMYWEEKGELFTATNISTSNTPLEIHTAVALSELLNTALTGANLFFLSESMSEELGHLNAGQYLYLLLSESFTGNLFFGINTCWPTMERTQLCYFSSTTRTTALSHSMTVRSQDIYSIIHWFARYTGQLQLIEEIGRTVAAFLYRPEGDSTFMGHDHITMSLPLFRSSRTILFVWPLAVTPTAYEPKVMPLYKVTWIGLIKYLQLTLTFNTALIANRVQTLAQLINLGINIPQSTMDMVNRLFIDRGRKSLITDLSQSIGIRFGWGQVWNRMTGSIIIRGVRIPNFTRIAQWSDWMLFERIGCEYSWLMGMMHHFSSTKTRRLHAIHQAKDIVDNALASGIYYRMDTMGVGDLVVIHGSTMRPPQIIEDVVCYSSITGLAWDGQFQDIRLSEDEWITFGFRLSNTSDIHNITQIWNKRKSYTWEVYSMASYSRERRMNQQPFMLAHTTADWGVPSAQFTVQDTSQPSYSMSDFTDPIYIPDGVIRFGHPTVPNTNGQPGGRQRSIRWETNRFERLNDTANLPPAVPELEPYLPNLVNQELHYCEKNREPTIGEQYLNGRIRVPRRNNQYQTPAEMQERATTESVFFMHQTIFNKKRQEIRANLARRGALPNLQPYQTAQQPIVVEQRPNPPATREQIVAQPVATAQILPPTIAANTLRTNMVDIIWKREVANFAAQYQDLGLTEVRLSDDPILQRFAQIATISPLELQFPEMMRRHLTDLIPLIEQTHYGDMVVVYPASARGHYCRVVLALMQAMANYVPNAGAHHNAYKNICTDFRRMSIGLSSFPFVTQQEWSHMAPNVDANGVLTYMLGTDSMDSLTDFIFGSVLPRAQAITARLEEEMAATIATDVNTDPGSNESNSSWTCAINVESNQSNWGDNRAHKSECAMWLPGRYNASHGADFAGRTHSKIRLILDSIPSQRLVGDSYIAGSSFSEPTSSDTRPNRLCSRHRVKLCLKHREPAENQEAEEIKHSLYKQLFSYFLKRFVPSAIIAKMKTGQPHVIAADYYSELLITDECTCFKNPAAKVVQQTDVCCVYSGEHMFCQRLMHDVQLVRDYLHHASQGKSLYFDADHGLCFRANVRDVHTKLQKLAQASQDVELYDVVFRSTPAVMPAEKRLQYCGINMGFHDLAETAVHTCSTGCLEELKNYKSYTEPPKAVSEVFQVHAVYVVEALPERRTTYCAVKRANPEMCDFELGAVFMWWGLMPEEVYNHFIDSGLHNVNLNTQKADIAQRLEIIRQQGSMCRCSIGAAAFQWLRKFGNLKGRDFGFCDIELEEKRHRYSYSRRYSKKAGEAASRENYLLNFKRHAVRIIEQIVGRLKDSSIDTIESWWNNRKKHTPKGSTTIRHVLATAKEQDERISSSDRPNKKATVEVLQGNVLRQLLATEPMSWARRSTKYEPGRKHRALYAVDDLSTIVAAYASQNVEKNMNIYGMCPQQRPTDVLEWWRIHDKSTPTQLWLSADYTDFNKEHSMAELQIVNYCFARAWNEICSHIEGGPDKTLASWWVARMFKNRHVVCSESKKEFPVYSALWSGSRDTARDNTILHNIYFNIINETVASFIPEYTPPEHIFMCGDDEDALFSNVADALAYYEGLKYCGWHANDIKQMCGFQKHEFLQKSPDVDRGCVGPISAMIAAMASGQWYKTPGMHQDCAIACISDQAWELYIRGGDLERVVRFAYRLLNAYMRAWSVDIENNGENAGAVITKKKLEWLRFRLSPIDIPDKYGVYRGPQYSVGPALWHGTETSYAIGKPPQVFYESQNTNMLPHRATQDYCNQFHHLFVKYASTQSFKEYVTDEAAESYGALYHSYLQKQKQAQMWAWPDRTATADHFDVLLSDRMSHHKKALAAFKQHRKLIRDILHSQGVKQLPLSDAELLGAVGADVNMFKRLGGYENHELVEELGINRKRKRVYKTWLELYPEITDAVHLMDPALRSFLLTTGPG